MGDKPTLTAEALAFHQHSGAQVKLLLGHPVPGFAERRFVTHDVPPRSKNPLPPQPKPEKVDRAMGKDPHQTSTACIDLEHTGHAGSPPILHLA